MAMKFSGVDGTFIVPRVVKNYVFTKFDLKIESRIKGATIASEQLFGKAAAI